MPEFKKCKVIMLPTKDNLEYPFIAIDMEMDSNNSILLVSGNSSNSLDYEPQHLYVISDEEIKLGDYYYRPGLNEIFRGSGFVEGDSKVIASTEKLNELPQIPHSFIKQYVESNGKIDEIDILNENLEIDSNNYIIIKPKIELPNQEEDVRKLALGAFKAAMQFCHTDFSDKAYNRFRTWFSQNYKIKPIKESWTREEVEQFRDLADAIINSASEVLGEEYNEEYENYFNWIEQNL